MAQSYLMEAEYGFGSLNFSELECLSPTESIFRDQFFFNKNELDSFTQKSPLNVSDSENKIHPVKLETNINKQIQNLNNQNIYDITEGMDYGVIKVEPKDVIEEITISDLPVKIQDTNIKEEDCIPVYESQVEVETTENSTVSPPENQVPKFFIMQPASSTTNMQLLFSDTTLKVISTDKRVLKEAEIPAFNLTDRKLLKRICSSNQESTNKKEAVDKLHNDFNIDAQANGKFHDRELSYQELQIAKRKLRMIKNRQSAFLSRERKREYVSSLEHKIVELQRENDCLKNENKTLKEQLEQQQRINDILWLPKHAIKHTNKKVATVMSCALLMVTFNLFKLRTLAPTEVNVNSNQNIKIQETLYHGRSLLWTKESQSYSPKEQTHHESTFWINDTSQMKCPIHINQTESMRIDSDLRKWIGVDKYRQVADNSTNFRPKTIDTNKRKIDFTLSTLLHRTKTRALYGEYSDLPSDMSPGSEEDIDIFSLRNELLFNDIDPLYRAMGRQRDTFYFVSFSEDHIILPAITHNITISPKMSLLLPSTIINESIASPDVVTMMQIDCAVTDTRLLRMKEKDIPLHLKTNFLKTGQRNDNGSVYRKGIKNKFRPSLRSVHSSRNSNSYNIHLHGNIRK